MNYDFPLAQIRKTTKDVIIKQLQTGDVVKVRSVLFPLIFHYGIVCRDTDKFIVYHNDPDRFNFFGGNIVLEDFEDWIKNKEIVEVIATNLKENCISDAVKNLKEEKYDLFNFNCEHFITKIKNQKPSSPQVFSWLFITGAIVTAFLIIRKK